MHVCLTIPNMAKRSGGPSTVVQHLSEHLAAAGASVTVMTGAIEPRLSEVLPRDQRINVIHVPAGGWRSACETYLQGVAARTGKKEAVVHDFGLWLPPNHAVASACNRLGVPRVCSTSGMLAPWALGHKAWKKKLAWWLYQRRDLARAALLAATSEQEAKDVRRVMPDKEIVLVPNGVDLPDDESKTARLQDPTPAAKAGQKTVVFLGRIHPVKGLSNLVQAWAKVRPAGWRCILAGPDEGGHQGELEALLRAANLENVFEFPGMVENEQKWALLRSADLFVLPSFTENFGISIAEALACGVPAIATRGTPWKDLPDYRCGWWIDIGAEPLAAALRQATGLADDARMQMGQRGRKLVAEKYSWSHIASELKSSYSWLLGGPARPRSLYNDVV